MVKSFRFRSSFVDVCSLRSICGIPPPVEASGEGSRNLFNFSQGRVSKVEWTAGLIAAENIMILQRTRSTPSNKAILGWTKRAPHPAVFQRYSILCTPRGCHHSGLRHGGQLPSTQHAPASHFSPGLQTSSMPPSRHEPCTGGPDVIRKEVWPVHRTIPGDRLC